MDYTRLGSSGLKVSRIALGCMSFGNQSRMPWALDDDAAEPFFRQAVEAGITLWDTANTYGHGTSEEITGRAITTYSRREDVVLATKLFSKMHEGAGGSGLSRRAVMEQVDASLTRLGTDYIDLYQIHRFDPDTPVEKTMEALHDVVKAGKIRYLGASSMWAWQFATMQHAADLPGWTRFVSMQDQYSLLQREEEREMFGLLAHSGVGSIPWSPLAAGRLARPWGEQSTTRSVTNPDVDFAGRPLFLPTDEAIINAVQQISESRGVSMAQVALAWVLCNPVVSAPIVGATKTDHLSDAVAALDLELTDEEVTSLEQSPTRPASPPTSDPMPDTENDEITTAVLAAYRDQNRWMVEGRTDQLARLLDDQYVAVHISGHQQDKTEWLAQIDSGRMTYDAVDEKSASVEIKGETAVLTVQALVTATIYGAHSTWPLKSVTRYARRDGTWKPIQSRATTY